MTACKLLWCQFIHVLGVGSYFYVNEVIAQKLKVYGTKCSNIVKRLLSNLSFVEIVLVTVANTLDFPCEFGSSGIQGALFSLVPELLLWSVWGAVDQAPTSLDLSEPVAPRCGLL